MITVTSTLFFHPCFLWHCTNQHYLYKDISLYFSKEGEDKNKDNDNQRKQILKEKKLYKQKERIFSATIAKYQSI